MKGKGIISRFAVSSVTVMFLWLLGMVQAQAVTVAPLPLELANGSKPNVILTFDDSGSMRRAYIPDDMNCSTAGNSDCGRDLKRGCSGSFNPVAYNPAIDYMPPLNASGVPMGNSTFTSAWTNGFNRTAQPTVNLSADFRPAWIMNGTSGNSASTSIVTYTDCGTGDDSGMAAYYMKYDPAGTSCSPAATSNDACYTNTTVSTTSGASRFRLNLAGVGTCPDPAVLSNAACTSQDEGINFANWYSYYRTRMLLAKSAAGTAFAKLDDDSIRIAYQRLNTCNGGLGVADAGACDGNYLKLFSSTARTNFFTWLYNSGANDSTPLRDATRRAGDHIGQTGLYSPFSQSPGNSANDPSINDGSSLRVEASCRQNYHVAFTDGFWRTGDTIRAGNFDTPDSDWNLPLPLGKSTADAWETYPGSGTYSSSGRFPYKDGNGSHDDSMADAAFYYWSRDARTDLDNTVAPNIVFPDANKTTEYWDYRNNPATWQHMVHFTVGLGVDGTLAFPGDLSDLISGTTTWPDTGNGIPANVDDLWHAAINSRGEYFSASDPTKLTSSFQSVLQKVLSRTAAVAGIGTTNNEINTGSRVYQVIYKSGDWYGRLLSFRLDPTTGDFQDQVSGVAVSEWDTSSTSSYYGNTQNGVPASRVIISRDLRAGTPAGIAFTWTALTNYAADFNTIPYSSPATTDTNGSARVSYLRGDATNEGTGLDFRLRSTTKIGDIVNAAPVFVPKGTTFNYPDGLESANHSAFRSSAVVTGRPRMVYVAGNDGMLHGFNADYDTSTNLKVTNSGRELLAYVPGTLLPEMGKLSSKEYQHQWYIDTTPAVADAFGAFPGCASSPCWRTIMVGGLGGGGKGIYALDVTDPANFSQANANTISLWEKNSSSTGFGELGLTYGKPVITRVRAGDGSANRVWAAIFSNGYNSTSGTAQLYIVNIVTGALIKVIDTGVGSDNGLSPTVPVIDPNNSEFVMDYVYAGDLKGNIWKFNISSNSSTNWKVAYDSNGDGTGTPVPIFTAELPAGTPQPITSRLEVGTHPDGKAGFIVYFGTGRYLTASDNSSTTVQSYYAIWDQGNTAITSTPVSRANLLTQTITGETPAGIRTTSSNTINFESPANDRGWYIDFNASNALGERVLSVAELSRGRLIFNTFIPSTNECLPDGEHVRMILNPRSGAALTSTPFDINGDGFACSCAADYLAGASGKRGRGRQGAPVTTLSNGDSRGPQDKLCYNDGVAIKCDSIAPGSSGIGRGAWKQLK